MNEYFYMEIADNITAHMKQTLDCKNVGPGDTAIIGFRCDIRIEFGADPSLADYKLTMEYGQ